MRPVLGDGPSAFAFDVVVALASASRCCARFVEAPYTEPAAAVLEKPAADAEADCLGAAPVRAESARFEGGAPLVNAEDAVTDLSGLSSATPKTARRSSFSPKISVKDVPLVCVGEGRYAGCGVNGSDERYARVGG